MPAYIDTHCHLDLFPGIRERPQVEDAEGIKTITVTNAPYLFAPNQVLFGQSRHIRVGLGFHPEALGDQRLLAQQQAQLRVFDEQLASARYIGEVGLDGSAAWKHTWRAQLAVLQHVSAQCGQTGGKIITAHSRGAVADVLDHLATPQLRAQQNKLVLHWFSGTSHELQLAVQAGAYFSVNHKMVQSKKGKDLLASMPQARVLTETDAPFTFDTHVKTRKQSLLATVDALASLWDTSHERAQTLVWANFQALLQ